MSNTAAPLTLDDFQHQPNALKTIQTLLNKNYRPYSIFVSGPAGTGKTSLINLYMQAVLGAAPDQHPNIIWISKGNSESLSSQINSAIEWTQTIADEHRFVVLDNLQAVPHQYLQEFLFHTELTQTTGTNGVTFIFECQDESAIDRVLLQALKDRSFSIRLQGYTEQQITKILVDKYPSAPLESISIIAYASKGNLGEALKVIAKSPDHQPGTVADELFLASSANRKQLWRLLNIFGKRPSSASYSALRAMWQQLAGNNELRLAQLLLQDLDMAMLCNPSVELLRAKQWLEAYRFPGNVPPASIRPWDAFKEIKHIEIPDDVFDEPNITHYERSGFERMYSAIG